MVIKITYLKVNCSCLSLQRHSKWIDGYAKRDKFIMCYCKYVNVSSYSIAETKMFYVGKWVYWKEDKQTHSLKEWIISALISFIKTSYLHRTKAPLPLLNIFLSFLKMCLTIYLILTLELLTINVFYQSAKIIGIHQYVHSSVMHFLSYIDTIYYFLFFIMRELNSTVLIYFKTVTYNVYELNRTYLLQYFKMTYCKLIPGKMSLFSFKKVTGNEKLILQNEALQCLFGGDCLLVPCSIAPK